MKTVFPVQKTVQELCDLVFHHNPFHVPDSVNCATIGFKVTVTSYKDSPQKNKGNDRGILGLAVMPFVYSISRK